MPRLPVLAAALLLAAPAAAQQPAPQRIGTFQSWTAAMHLENGARVCYAFARATRSEGVQGRREVILTVTHRGASRDQVAITAGYTYPRDANVTVSVGATELSFYTAGGNAFARDGRAAVAAFRQGREAVARGPAPTGRGQVSDSFPLNGFSAAYEAITRECPAPRR
jgi:invasion protein IalB